jgi:small-conductance mechanosensitive channel
MNNETVSLEVVDFLLGRLIGEIQINRELNEKVAELKAAIDTVNKHTQEQIQWIQNRLDDALEEVNRFEEAEDKDLNVLRLERFERAEARKKRGRPKGSKNKIKVVRK